MLLQVLDNDIVLKIERKILLEIPAELSGLLEPVSDPETRLKLLSNYKNPSNNCCWVLI